jgi:hypothetical protein
LRTPRLLSDGPRDLRRHYESHEPLVETASPAGRIFSFLRITSAPR